MLIVNEAAKLNTEHNILSEHALNVYKFLNKKEIENFTTISLYKDCLNKIFEAHNQFPKITYIDLDKPIFSNSSKVLVCCSGGLDSIFQSLYLRDKGYNVSLFHLRNANVYSNGQEFKVFEEFAKKFNFNYYIANISPNFKSDYKKQWQENSFKNGLIYSIAIDYMLSNGIEYLSSGDDLRLTIDKQALGVNTGDCSEITDAFINGLGAEFIPVDRNINKADRLKFIYSKDAGDYFLSCVGPGRLIQSQRHRYETKFNVKLDKWNCGCSCRKDAMHTLLNYYYNGMNFPKELIDRAWDKISIGADNIFFDKSIDLNTRIKNLIEY